MGRAVQIVELANLAAFAFLAIVAVRQWRERRDRAAAWAAVSFGAIAFVVLTTRLVPDDPQSFAEHALQRLDVVVLLLFPYLLYRFTVAFDSASPRLARIVDSATTALVVWTLVLPGFPGEGESRPWWFSAYLSAFVLHWSLLSLVVVSRLWRSGRGQPGVARRRMEMLSFGAAAITVALVLAVFVQDARAGVELPLQAIVSLSVLAFLLGLAPPHLVRAVWRRAEEEQLQTAVSSLMTQAESAREVADRVLPSMAAIVAARKLELADERGRVIASHDADGDDSGDAPLEVAVPERFVLRVWTSRYAPFFGDEEERLLRSLGLLAGLALDRARLFGQERAARLTLERADELKSEFVALAAHELRSPVATAAAIAETLTRHRDRLDDAKRLELENVMAAQMERLATLVDQLLDLSRLDAEVVAIRPERLHVRERVEQLVLSTAGTAAGIDVAIDPELEADVDPVAFDRIVSNLVTNALRYGTRPIVVAARRSDRHFRLTVEDRGDGVPAEFVPTLFDRFTRSAESRDRLGGIGTGLGLAIARSYARAHRGDLLYEPAQPRGACFQLVLPARG